MVFVVDALETVCLVQTVPTVTHAIEASFLPMVLAEDVEYHAPIAVLQISCNAYHVQMDSPSSTLPVFPVLINVKLAAMVCVPLVSLASIPIQQEYVSLFAK